LKGLLDKYERHEKPEIPVINNVILFFLTDKYHIIKPEIWFVDHPVLTTPESKQELNASIDSDACMTKSFARAVNIVGRITPWQVRQILTDNGFTRADGNPQVEDIVTWETEHGDIIYADVAAEIEGEDAHKRITKVLYKLDSRQGKISVL
jgi:hypothetical protein